jgi:hypothetical protein
MVAAAMTIPAGFVRRFLCRKGYLVKRRQGVVFGEYSYLWTAAAKTRLKSMGHSGNAPVYGKPFAFQGSAEGVRRSLKPETGFRIIPDMIRQGGKFTGLPVYQFL